MCANSIAAKTSGLSAEVIVVNNDEGILSKNSLPPNTRVIEVGKNIGFGAAANRGVTIATGKFLCFLNPDAEISTGHIRQIIERFQSNQSLGIIGPRIVTTTTEVEPWSAGREVTLWSIVCNNLGFPAGKRLWESTTPVETAWVSGACFFIPTGLFRQLNGFDEQFFMYFEDVDLAKRVRATGRKVLRVPDLTVRHLGGQSFQENSEQKKLYYASQKKYFRKYFGFFACQTLSLLHAFSHRQ